MKQFRARYLGSVRLVLVMLASIALVGCGIGSDLSDLTCGYSTCPDAGPDAGRPDAAPDSTVMSVDSGKDAAAVADSSAANDATVGNGDGSPANANDGGWGIEASCSACGGHYCCGPQQMCINDGAPCCNQNSATCGGDVGSCCPGWYCTGRKTCESSCTKPGGSCMVTDLCCLGESYCDTSTNTCVLCLPVNAPCTTSSQCCGGDCSSSNHVCVNNN